MTSPTPAVVHHAGGGPGMVSLRWWCSIEASGALPQPMPSWAYQDKRVAEVGDRGVTLIAVSAQKADSALGSS